MRPGTLTWIPFALALLGGGAALGAPPAGDAVAQAEKLYLEGAALYRTRHYDEAVRIFERAYRVYPEPNLLYNMGRCYEAMGRLNDAIERYRRFVADNRSASEAKDKARAKIALLSKMLAKAQAKPQAEPRATGRAGRLEAETAAAPRPGPQRKLVEPAPRPQLVEPAPQPGSRFSLSKWLVGISGLALAGGGAALFLLGHADHQKVQDAIDAADGGVVAMPQSEAAALVDDGDRKKLIGYVLMGAGAAALITSAVLFAAGGAEEAPDATSARVTLTEGGALLGVGGRF